MESTPCRSGSARALSFSLGLVLFQAAKYIPRQLRELHCGCYSLKSPISSKSALSYSFDPATQTSTPLLLLTLRTDWYASPPLLVDTLNAPAAFPSNSLPKSLASFAL